MPYRNPEDQKRAARKHYDKHKSDYVARAAKHNKKAHGIIRRYILDYLACHPCVDCGEGDPIVLEFDHKDRSEKKFAIANFRQNHTALPKIIAEIKKCDVRCANCHRRRSFLEKHWMAADEADDDEQASLF